MELEEAIALAAEAHRGQVDKLGQPYILHPLRVMLAVDTPAERLAAVLHDVVEDTPLTLEDLRRRGCPEDVVTAVDCLSRREGEDYVAFVSRAAGNAIARRVKIADIEDNISPSRVLDATEKDRQRRERYRKALATLKELA